MKLSTWFLNVSQLGGTMTSTVNPPGVMVTTVLVSATTTLFPSLELGSAGPQPAAQHRQADQHRTTTKKCLHRSLRTLLIAAALRRAKRATCACSSNVRTSSFVAMGCSFGGETSGDAAQSGQPSALLERQGASCAAMTTAMPTSIYRRLAAPLRANRPMTWAIQLLFESVIKVRSRAR